MEEKWNVASSNFSVTNKNELVSKKSTPILSPFRLTLTLSIIVTVLLALHLAVLFFEYKGGPNSELSHRLNHFFNFNKEGNIPTFFSYSLLFIASILLFIIYKLTHVKSVDRKYWLFLSFTFLYMSLDEAIQIHERLNSITRIYIKNDLSGLLYWAWVVPYTLLTLVVGIYLLRFLLRLPARTRKMFLISGFIFFTGAVGIEIVEGYFIKLDLLNHTKSFFVYAFTITVQELMEMCGVIIFINELMRYLEDNHLPLYISKPD